MVESWKQTVAEKRQRQQASIPKEWILPNRPSKDVLDVTKYPEQCGLLNGKEVQITNSDVDTLLEKLASQVWSAVDVTTAFAKRAVIAHQLTGCLTEIFVERAHERAARLDQHLKETGKVVGPLHGLPISLKDQINVQGIESTMGYVSWVGIHAAKNATLVDILESLGAVFYVKTNVPQTLMWPETFNNVFGRTLNPHNRSLTSGGSSGGEGALLALKGSPLGVGSDIGGSIRIPSGLCGTYGLRPSYNRTPYGGCVNSMEGEDSILSVLGPLCTSLSGVKRFMQGVLSRQPWLNDPLVIKKPWNDEEYALRDRGNGKELCFAILWDDGYVVPHPPVVRGLEMTKNALLKAGHKVIDWTPIHHEELFNIAYAIWNAGFIEDVEAVTSLSSEPLITTMDPNAEFGVSKTPPKPKRALSAYQLWQLQKRKLELRQEYLDHWQSTSSVTGTGRPVDAIIAPMAPYTAPPHGQNKTARYTVPWNVLDYTALVIPVSRVDPAIDVKKPPHQFKDEKDKMNYDLYDPEVFKNGPICVQLVGRTLEEEAVIAMSEIVDAALKDSGAGYQRASRL